MSKEEAERSSARMRSSSMPPREGAPPHRPLPSTPPQTDDIDTDWGAEQPVATQGNSPSVGALTLTATAASNVTDEPLVAPAPEQAPPVITRSATPPPAAPPLVQSVRSSRPHAQTLLGMPAPKLRSAAPASAAPAAPATPEAASSTALSTLQNEIAARQTPLPTTTTSEQAEPRAPLPTPLPDAPAEAEHARSSMPPAIAPPSPVAASPAPAQAARERSASGAPPAAAAAPKRSGRAVVWLAVAGLGLGALGYMASRRAQPPRVSADVQAAVPAAPPTQAPPAKDTPTLEPAAMPSAPGSAAPSSASAAPSSANSNAPALGIITVTVKSVPPKARIFHFGKQVGVTPWVVELKPGERHAYEVGSPGRVTRKLVLDGSKTEITVGLKPAP
ncbi:MAG: hypothetical protein ABJB12_06630 [Pseudomonadota bacterium]